jgi:ATP-dependent exoDNAse (exonuclease V) alpha subunit
VLEQSVGELDPRQALAAAKAMIAERHVLPLQSGLMTTLQIRAQEQAIERRFAVLAQPADREVGDFARELAVGEVAQRIGSPLSEEQALALQKLTGPERAAVLVGPAGTGKGVVIDAAARAELLAGRDPIGVAVSWSTAQRLGRESEPLSGRIFSVDALISRERHGQVAITAEQTIYFDEAGMADTRRLGELAEMVERRGAKLVLIGDAAQLPSIGAGGMFERLTHIAPSAELSDVRRTLDPAEQRAWADLRAGRSEKAMAHYLAEGRLHFSENRDEAVEHVRRKLGEADRSASDRATRPDLRRLEQGDPPPQCPRPALSSRARRARR